MAKQNVCPGCSRHCRISDVRCKYGKKLFAKTQKERAKENGSNVEKNKPHKWEKHVQRGGLIWQLLWVAGLSKRALRRKQIKEERLLAALNEEEQKQLHLLLKKLVDVVISEDGHS